VIDDTAHWPKYHADILLNQNINAYHLTYECDPDTTLLLGTRYVLLRSEFLAWRNWQRNIPEKAHKVLVTLGGGDSDNKTFKVIQALQKMDRSSLEARIVVGPTNPNLDILHQLVGDSNSNLQLLTIVTKMSELMAWADVAISAGGSTCWELAFMGLPALLLILADNQQAVAEGLDAAGAAVNLGRPDNLTPTVLAHALSELALSSDKRTILARHSQELVDGNGAARTVKQMKTYGLSLRPEQADDCRLIWEWANDPITRAASFSSKPIPWKQHKAWFATKLTDTQCLFYIALNAAKVPVGQIRYDIEGQEAVVSVALAPGCHGHGYGSQIIRLASQQVFENTSVNVVHAYIKTDNIVSVNAFAKAEFINDGATEIKGHPALHFVLRRKETKP
jgi:spore coat polysaccharide biosynthesis predicted glycosyltransferase SpsG/RimJ/RimL family protein N-acetyltransferase